MAKRKTSGSVCSIRSFYMKFLFMLTVVTIQNEVFEDADGGYIFRFTRIYERALSFCTEIINFRQVNPFGLCMGSNLKKTTM